MYGERPTADLLLADSVAVAEGKLYVQGGGWNAIRAENLPVRHARFGIAIVLRVPYRMADNSSRRFSIRIEDEDSSALALSSQPGPTGEPEPVTAVEGTFSVGRAAGLHPGDAQQVPMAVNLDGLVFQRAGLYFLRLAIDGEDVRSASFRVSSDR